MKNPNGFGSVYKLSGNRRRPYIARKTIGYNPITGNAIKVTIGYYKTKKEATIVLQSYLKKPERVLTDKMTFKEVFNLWREIHYKTITDTTKNHYDKFYKIAISPYFDKMIFKDIKFAEVQIFMDNLNYSKSTSKLIKAILKNVWIFALKNDFIDKNIIELVNVSGVENVIKRRIFTKKEIDILWEHKNNEIVASILILIYTGMRINELLKLKNKDINLEERYLIAGSKTLAGKDRIIPINLKIFPLITKRMNLKNDFLFMKFDKKINYSTYAIAFKNILSNLGIENHTVHDTRHTFASMLNNANANTSSIKAIIGHSSYVTTEKIYTHKDLTELRKAIELL